MRGEGVASAARCRACSTGVLIDVLNLAEQPLAGHFPMADEAATALPTWPLQLMVCRSCRLVQLTDAAPEEPDEREALATPISSTMSDHLDAWAAEVAERLDGANGTAIELASHGGSLYRQLGERGIRSTVLDPDPDRATRLRRLGIPAHRLPSTAKAWRRLAVQLGSPRVIVDQYLLAHVRRPVALLAGLRRLARPDTELVLECEYVVPVLATGRFDSVRHGHFSYFSLWSLERALDLAGWRTVDAARHTVFGGTLRVWAGPAVAGTAARSSSPGRQHRGSRLTLIRAYEEKLELDGEGPYRAFAERAREAGRRLVEALRIERAAGRRVAAYGAPTRGNTLLNSCGIGRDLVEFTVDADESKHGRLLPGSGIPILPPVELDRRSPDTVLMLTWDLAAEIMPRLPATVDRPLRVILPLPDLTVLQLPVQL